MSPANLAPNHTRTILFATCDAVHVRDTFAEIPLRVLRTVNAFESEEAHVGVRVAFAALVANMAGFDVYCTHCYYVHDVIIAAVTYGGGSFLKTSRLLCLFVSCQMDFRSIGARSVNCLLSVYYGSSKFRLLQQSTLCAIPFRHCSFGSY
jgi:hypothetical protein